MMSGLFDTPFAWDEAPTVAEDATVAATPPLWPKASENLAYSTNREAALPNVAGVATVASWSRGLQSLAIGYAPDGMSERDWARLQADGRTLLVEWGEDLARLGWSSLEVFGTNANQRHRRVDRLGLLAILDGNVVEAVTADTATIRHGRHNCLLFNRPIIAPGGVAVWDLDREGRK